MALRTYFSLASILLLAGAITMMFFIILSGASEHTPLNKFYFLQAGTAGITGGRANLQNPIRWTYFALCGVHNNKNANCGKVGADIPFDPVRNFGTTAGVPHELARHRGSYYYISRIGWAFFLITLFFAVVAFFMSVAAPCSRLAARFTGLMTFLALFMMTIAAALSTAWMVDGHRAFKRNGNDSKIGEYILGFIWGSWACFFLATIGFCMGGNKDKQPNYSSRSYFGRKKSARSERSRGSFRDSEVGGGVKDEYD